MDNNTTFDASTFFAFSTAKYDSVPNFKETKAAHIPWGADNNYGAYLVELMNSSSKHNSLLTKKVNMTAGAGFVENAALVDFFANTEGKEDLETMPYHLMYRNISHSVLYIL